MTDEPNDLAKLRDLVRTNDIGMLATLDSDGQLEARPMALQDFDDAGRLWFFTEFQAPKADQVFSDPRALVTFSGRNYVSIHGKASVVQDPERQTQLWNKGAEAWLQCEPTDAKVALLVVDAEGAEFWETPGFASGVLGIVVAAVKGEQPDIGTNEKGRPVVGVSCRQMPAQRATSTTTPWAGTHTRVPAGATLTDANRPRRSYVRTSALAFTW